MYVFPVDPQHFSKMAIEGLNQSELRKELGCDEVNFKGNTLQFLHETMI